MVSLEVIHRPAVDADYGARSGFRRAGLEIGVVGLLLTTVAFAANIAAGQDLPGDVAGAQETLAWSFGLTTAGFGLLKLGIAVVLMGIVVRLWMRADGIKSALARLLPGDARTAEPAVGPLSTDYGPAVVTEKAPRPLLVHRISRVMWAPLLAMGLMLVLAGLALSVVQSGNVLDDPGLARDQGAWVQGLQFLGEGLLLSGISFLLGTILYGLRTGGAEVQESLGLRVKTLRMPATAKAFLVLMMLGFMAAIAQFVLYVVAAATVEHPTTFVAWSAWLGPARELMLGLLLSGIVLALVSIGTVLAFQFSRLQEIIRYARPSVR